MGPTTHPGAPGASSMPWCLMGPTGLPQVLPWLPSCLLVQKKSPKSFAAFGLSLVLIFCGVKNKQKTSTDTGTMLIG